MSYLTENDNILMGSHHHQMMMSWESEYMEKCIDALNPFGDVLEVGFGMGYSANRIQYYKPKSHTILEPDPFVYQKALEWSKNYTNVKVINQPWPRMEGLEKYDCFFYDPYIELIVESKCETVNDNLNNFNTQEEVESMIRYKGCDIIFFIVQSLKFLSKSKVKFSFYSCTSRESNNLSDWISVLTDALKESNLNIDCNFTFDNYYPNRSKLIDKCNYYYYDEDELEIPLIEVDFV